jgi:hypothetical protein
MPVGRVRGSIVDEDHAEDSAVAQENRKPRSVEVSEPCAGADHTAEGG